MYHLKSFPIELFRYSKSIYGGSDLMIGANWDLLPWFVGAGAAFIVVQRGADGPVPAARPRAVLDWSQRRRRLRGEREQQ